MDATGRSTVRLVLFSAVVAGVLLAGWAAWSGRRAAAESTVRFASSPSTTTALSGDPELQIPMEDPRETREPDSAVAMESSEAGSKPAETPTQATAPLDDEQQWRASIEKLDYAALRAELKRLREEFQAKSLPELQRNFDLGRYEYLGPEKTYKGQPGDDDVIFSVQMTDKGSHKVVLQESEYPDLYKLWRRYRFVDGLEFRRSEQ